MLQYETVRNTISQENPDSFTALELAIGTGSLDCVKILVEINPKLLERRNKDLSSVLDCVLFYAPKPYRNVLHQYLVEKITKHKVIFASAYPSKELLRSKVDQLTAQQHIKKLIEDRVAFLKESCASELKWSGS